MTASGVTTGGGSYALDMAQRPVDPETDPVVVPINDDPGIDFRDWLAARAPAEPVDIGRAATDSIRAIRDNGET